MTDRERLIEWMKARRTFKSSDVIRWGCESFSNRADRNKRQLIKEGLVKKLTRYEMSMYGFFNKDGSPSREAAYKWIGERKPIAEQQRALL